MLDEWFYKSQGAEIGPITWDDMKWLADHDKLDRNALVRQGRTGKFLLAKRVKGLINLAAKPLASPGDPPAASSPTKTPQQPPRAHSPTLSFTPAKDSLAIALPPTMQPPATPVKKVKPKSEKPAMSAATTPIPAIPPPPAPLAPPLKSKPPVSIDELLPPPAVPKQPPRK